MNMTNYKQKVLDELDELPEEKIKEVIDFLEFLIKSEKKRRKLKENIEFRSWHLGGFKGITREGLYKDV